VDVRGLTVRAIDTFKLAMRTFQLIDA